MEKKPVSWAQLVQRNATPVVNPIPSEIKTTKQEQPPMKVVSKPSIVVPNNIKLPNSQTNVSVYSLENWESDDHGEQNDRLNADVICNLKQSDL
jgi:hypothetical protein